MSATILKLPASTKDEVTDLWEAYQDMFFRLMGNPGLADDPAFMARMHRAHGRFERAYNAWCGE